MDEKTEALRDIFLVVADDATVTEAQEESRGSLADEADADERLRAVIAEMQDRYSFSTDLSSADLAAVVRGYYDGQSDGAIAAGLGADADEETVADARLDLHLLGEEIEEAPIDLGHLRELLAEDSDPEDIAAHLDTDAETVRRYRRVAATRAEIRAVGDRFREEFETILADGALRDRLTDAVREDGLDDATEGMETNVSF